MSPLGRGNSYNKGLYVVFLCLGIFVNAVATRTMWKLNGNTTKLLSEFDPRIVGGNTIAITMAPWQVSVRLRTLEREFFGAGHICGGSLMSPRVVISAAHCVLNESNKPMTYRTPSEFVLVMGSADIYEITQYTYEYDVINIQVNAGFNFTTMANDVALFFIDGTVPSGLATVSPIPLNHVAEPNGTMCMVTGWGATMQNGYISSRLMGAYVPIVSNTVCATNYTGIGAGMLCAGYMKLGGIDACQGDSGGPLTCNNVLVGIVSWGNGCAKPGYPGVYTNVSYYNAWIAWANSTFDYGNVDVVYDYYGGTSNIVNANNQLLLGLCVLLLLQLSLLDQKICCKNMARV